MFGRALAAILALGLTAGMACAQANDKQERLKRLLEEKYGGGAPDGGGASRGLSRPKVDNNDVYVIRPDGSVRQGTDGMSGGSGRGGRGSSLEHGATMRLAASASATEGSLTDSPPGFVVAQAADDVYERRRAPAIIAKRNSFVIKLKPDVTESQIDALVQRYKLKVRKLVPSLGVLYVEIEEGSPESSRSLAPPGRETMSSVLEPKIVKELRNDPAVDAAFVNSTIGPKALPRRSDVKAQSNATTVRWSWSDETDDGNWGLKAIRMPPVWTILDRVRAARANQARTRVSFLDNGFGTHKGLQYSEVWGGGIPPQPTPVDCGRSHGTHVAGIVGSAFNKGSGIDGMVPDAKIEAIPISRELLSEGFNDGITDQAQQHVSFFMDAIADLSEFLDQVTLKPGERRVVNVSLAYNWSGVALASNSDPTTNRIIRDQVRQHAKVVQTVVNRWSDRILFVAAAGNDSASLEKPLTAEYATPFAYAGTHIGAGFTASKNIIVVEAEDRDGSRAPFSNVGGHVAAPGVDIMSTLAGDKFGVCSGTSQAAPHVTALAAILFELDPSKTPAEIADIIKSSAVPGTGKTDAPRIDALEAVLKLSPDYLRYLADLNGDGKVDDADLMVFKQALVTIEEAKYGAEPIKADLNGDGVVDDYERCWPIADLNGSGRLSYEPADARPILGATRTDLQVIELAWTDKSKPYEVAVKDTGLDELLNVWNGTALVAAAPEASLKQPCGR